MKRAAGDGLLHPVPLLAIGVLVVNDHVLKAAWGNDLTGKLSDVAGLLFFPLLLQGLIEVIGHRGGELRPSRRLLVGCAVATAAVFSAIQVIEPAADAYRFGLGALQWPFRALASLASGGGLPPVRPVSLTPDPTDLWTVPAVIGAVAAGWSRCRTPETTAGGR